jgi:hypothetical protein
VRIARTDCTVDTAASSTGVIVCDLVSPMVHGSWTPEIRDANGLAKLIPAFSPFVFTGSITGVTPNTNLNKAGGEPLVITGTGFPASLTTGHIVFVVFSPQNNLCRIKAMTSTEIQCETNPFEKNSGRRMLTTTTAVYVEIDRQAMTEFTGLELADSFRIVNSITPNSVSPILLKTLVIQLDSSYDNTGMDADTFTVSIYPVDPENTQGNVHIEVTEHERFLNVIG